MLPEDAKVIMANLMFIIFSVFALCFSKANADINKFQLDVNPSEIIEKIIK